MVNKIIQEEWTTEQKEKIKNMSDADYLKWEREWFKGMGLETPGNNYSDTRIEHLKRREAEMKKPQRSEKEVLDSIIEHIPGFPTIK